MRYIKLSISLLISVVGLVVYFITVPSIHPDEFMDLTVQAGDDTLLDDYSFNGYIHPYGSFTLTSDEIIVPATLPYLERLDASDEMDIMLLKEAYPEFVNELIFGANTHAYLISAGEDYLTSAHFEYQDTSYAEIYSNLHLRLLNKETNEIEEDIVERDVGANIYYTRIVGMYENYPEMKVLIDTRLGDSANFYDTETGELSLISYNFETKNMTETILLETDNYIYPVDFSTVHNNQSLQAFDSSGETSEPIKFVVDYTTDEMIEFEGAFNDILIISDDSRLYGIADTTLVEYSGSGQEVVREVELSTDFQEKKTMDVLVSELAIMDGKLFVLNNNDAIPDFDGADATPSDLVVYDVTTGDILAEAQFTFDGVDQVDAFNVYIESITKNTSKD